MTVQDGQEQDARDFPTDLRGEASREPSWPGRAALVWLPFALAALFYAPLLLGVRTFPRGDFTDHFLPFSLFQRSALAAGQLPIWNPYTYSGHPFLADVQAAVFYPISNLILAATLPVAEAAARLYLLQVEAVVHIALAGLFSALLVEALTHSRAAALVAGVSFAFSGYLTGYPPLQLAVLRTAVWLPAILWCVLAAWQARRGLLWWSGAGVALAVAFLAGHPQTYLLTLYALAAWLALLAVVDRRDRSRVMRGIGGALWMAGAAAGLSAAQWLPSLEFLRLSVRADVSYAFVSGGFPLQDSWQLLLPGVLTTYSPLYIGVGGLQLALCALIWAVACGSQARADVRGALPWRVGVGFFGGMAFLALLASYGANGPFYPLLYRFAPGWNLFRGQERAAYLVALALCVLAGYGLALTPRVGDAWRRRGALWGGAVMVAGVYAFGLLWQMAGRTAIGNGAYLLIAARTLIVGAAVALMVWLPDWPRRKVQLLAVMVVGMLFVANAGTNLDAGTPSERAQVAPEIRAVQQAVAESDPASGVPGRVYNEYRVYDDYGMRAQVEDVWGSSPLRLARYARLFEGFPLDRMWRLLGVEHVLTWRRELFGPTELLADFPKASDTTYLHRLPGPHPRAWWVNAVQVVGDDTAWQMLADHQVDLGGVALVAQPIGVEIAVAPGEAAVRLTRLAHHRLRVEVSRAAPGFLVVAENWMPGWRVTQVRCAEPAACLPGSAPGDLLQPVRADLTLVGVPVPAGEVAFDLVYAPASVRWGLWISGMTALLLVALIGGSVLRRRSEGA
ncbi:MAG: YfhO family protein [Caldilineaceae bacterium]|nr:YfhO family protein [Caldilineaceae bacterium]